MKIPALLTALALTCGTAFAAGSGEADRGHSAAATSDTQPRADNDGIVDKTKRALRRMGDKIRSATSRDSDTRAMGASGAESDDSARRRRMDEAYENWRSQQQKR